MSDIYPEHEKLNAISDQSQSIGEFMEWLFSERRIVMAEYPDAMNPADDRNPNRLWPAHVNIITLLAEFFEIDQNKIEAEKRAMLESIRAAPNGLIDD